MRMGRLEPTALALARSSPPSVGSACPGPGSDHVSAAAHNQSDRVAGFLCAFSFALSGIAMTRNPGVLATAAIIVALVAARMTAAHRKLAGVAVAVGGAAFVVGMTVAVLTDSGLY